MTVVLDNVILLLILLNIVVLVTNVLLLSSMSMLKQLKETIEMQSRLLEMLARRDCPFLGRTPKDV